MKVYNDFDQGDLDWLRVRMGKVTASEADNIITPEFKIRTGDTPESLISHKIAEMIQGRPLPQGGSWATEQGHILQEEAIPWYALEYDCKTTRPAFMEHDNGFCGCSPDAIVNGEYGLEVKSPQAGTHVKYLRKGVVPKEYIGQVHFSLYVTGFDRWDFLSYRREFPNLVITIRRDEKICKVIGEAIEAFHEKLTTELERIKNL